MASDQSIEKENAGRIMPVDIVSEMKESYIDYAMSVIVTRALPDVRDGLKPVHRRILYAMAQLGLHHNAKFRKSALVVGEVLGKFHPHGDIPVYDALVRMAQDFNMLQPLITGQGNFGSLDGDPPAAMRYSEVKLAPLASELLRDMDKDTVDFVPTYDNYHKEPSVLPAAFPNLLINGTLGIAVGMATRIPPHNLGEVIDALVYLIDHPEGNVEDLLRFIKGPDFPTGGVIFNEQDIHQAAASGRGGVLMRGEAEVTDNKILISSLPYQVNKAELIVKIANLVREKRIEGVRDIRDESTTLDNIRIVIELRSGAFPQKILNSLYKYTELETVFHYNMLALVDGTPRLLSLRGLAEEFLDHRERVVTRRSQFDLNRALEREHILLGLKKAIDLIDQVIQTIRRSETVVAARTNLISRFKFSEKQAEAILEMKLQKLAGLEMKRVAAELKEQQALIGELRILLADRNKIRQIVKKELLVIKDKFARPRKTKVIRHGVKELRAEDLIPDTENVLVVTSGGFIKRTDPAEYRLQKRGGRGVIDLDVKAEDFVNIFLTASTHSDLLFFTDRGKAYQIKMYDVPEGKRATRGKSVMNFLPLAESEKITSVLAVPVRPGDRIKAVGRQKNNFYLTMITRKGVVKKVALENFTDVRRNGILAIRLGAGDALLRALLVAAGDEVMISSREGQAIRFKEKDVRVMGRTASGVRAMRLKPADQVVAASVVSPEERSGTYLTVTENGYGKKSKLAHYKTQKRGGSGLKTFKINVKTGKVIDGQTVSDEESEIIAISKFGQVIRTAVKEIPVLGRQTQGVRIMKLRENDKLASLTFL